jgi:hypothetical protein
VVKFSWAGFACHCRIALSIEGAAFAQGSGRGSGTLATAHCDNLRHFRTVTVAWVGPAGGSVARAPSFAVVGRIVSVCAVVHRTVLDRLDLDRLDLDRPMWRPRFARLPGPIWPGCFLL